jgi:hypothetical protein
VLVLGLALYAAATVGSASGARAPGALSGGALAWDCDPQAPSDTSLYSGAVLGRGVTTREPDLGEIHTDLPASAKNKAAKTLKASVPVYFHVVTDGSIGNLTNAQIAAQMNVLNKTFAGSGVAPTRASRSNSRVSPARITRPGSTPGRVGRTSTR